MRPLVPTLIEEFPAYRLHPDGTLESRFRLGRQPGMSLYTDKWRVRNLRPKESGYIGVHLGRPDGPSRRTHIHRLLAEVFIGPPPFPRACARHIDGNGFNNHALRRFSETLKDAIDPNGIMSPGRYGIWGKALREKRS